MNRCIPGHGLLHLGIFFPFVDIRFGFFFGCFFFWWACDEGITPWIYMHLKAFFFWIFWWMGEVLKDFCVVNFLNYSTPPFLWRNLHSWCFFWCFCIRKSLGGSVPRLKTLFFFSTYWPILWGSLSGWPYTLLGNEGPSTFTNWYIGDETEPSFPKGQLVVGSDDPFFLKEILEVLWRNPDTPETERISTLKKGANDNFQERVCLPSIIFEGGVVSFFGGG